MKEILNTLIMKIHIIFKLNIFRAYFTIICALILQSMFMYSFYNNTLIQHTTIVNNILLENSVNKIETDILELEKLSVVLNSSAKINYFYSFPSELSNFQLYEAIQIVKELKSYVGYSKIIKDIFVFFNNGITLSSKGKYDTSQLINEIKPEFLSIESRFNKYNYRNMAVIGNSEEDLGLVYLQSLPFGRKSNIRATLAILINDDYLCSVLHNNRLTENTLLALFLPDQEMAVCSNIDSGSVSQKMIEMSTTDNYIFRMQLSKLNLEIVSIVPKSEFNIHKIYLRGVISYIILFTFLISILLALYFVYKDYKYIHDIYSDTGYNLIGKPITNIFDYIKFSIERLKTENLMLKKENNKNTDIIREYALSRIFSGETENISQFLEEFEICITASEYIVCVVDIKEGLPEKTLNVKQILHKNLFYTNDILTCLNNKMVIIVIGISNNIEDSIISIGSSLSKIFESESNSSAIVGISSKKNNIECLRIAYYEALESVKYGVLYGYRCVSYEQIKPIIDRDLTFYYPIEMEQKIINNIKAGNTGTIYSTLEEIYDNNFKHNKLTYDKARLLIIELVNTILKVTKDIDLPIDSDIYKFAVEDISIIKAFADLKKHCSNLCEYIKNNKKSSNQKLFENITGYITENYNNEALSLDLVADEFNISRNYLSQFFKEQAGIYFKDYVNMIRINKAKELLDNLQGEIKIHEVARMVGYRDSGSLIRAFNRYLGVTPGEYRDRY
ncbi:MAG TPA: helix-turn-helix domain-containing protein [Clostridiaceae bacterium]|nr:helix-turn-helix domain-containing protein [Clostridiaceae bacterium]